MWQPAQLTIPRQDKLCIYHSSEEKEENKIDHGERWEEVHCWSKVLILVEATWGEALPEHRWIDSNATEQEIKRKQHDSRYDENLMPAALDIDGDGQDRDDAPRFHLH